METKHTKGEWKQNRHCVFIGENEIIGVNVICRLHSGVKDYQPLEQEANAKLIAAAPDLLAALSELHDLAMDGYDSHIKAGTHSEFLKEDREVLKNALRAIKKAIE